MQNILWESFQKNWTSMQDIPLDARPPQRQGLQRIPASSGVLTFPLWSCSWPSSVRPHSSPQSSLFHSLNSFLMFREASHQANRLWGSPGLRYRKSLWGLGRERCAVQMLVWRGAGEHVRASSGSFLPHCLPRKGEKGHRNPWDSCSFSEQFHLSSWEMRPVWLHLPSWNLHYVLFIEQSLCANYLSRHWRYSCEQKWHSLAWLLT